MSGLHSLQGRLIALVLAVVTTVWLATAVATWIDVRHELDELLDSHLAQAAALLVVQQVQDVAEREHDDREDGPGGDGREARRLDAPSLHRYAPRVTFQVWHEGVLVLRSAQASDAPLSQRREGFDTVTVAGEAWRVFAARGADHDVQVYVAEHEPSRLDILWAAMRSTLWPMALALPLLALAIWAAVRAGLQPLGALRDTLAARTPGDLSELAVSDSPRELQPLIATLNTLLGRMARVLDAERRFTADAAHELRTPIAAVRAQAQVALGATTEADRRHALQATVQGCDRAGRLVDQMLTLARLEAQPASSAGTPVDLVGVARQVLADLAPLALARDQNLSLAAPEALRVHGDEAWLGVLVRNLVDNAIRYSPPGAEVQVSVGADAQGRVALSVDDSGPGLSPAQCERLGERFFRVPGTEAAGSGLGGSIVRRVAQALGADVQVGRSSALGGLSVTVRWPPGA